MKLQYASFLLPFHAGSAEQDELNRFLRGHRIVQTRKEPVDSEGASGWAVLVEYLDSPEKSADGQQPRSKVDYMEICTTWRRFGRRPPAGEYPQKLKILHFFSVFY
jgi:hypothetical protein